MICADAATSFELDTDCLDRLERFRARTVFSFGEDAMGKLYQGKILEMAFYVSAPFAFLLLHKSP